jgi:hypothetical protein
VLAQVAAAAHHQHPLPLLLLPRHLQRSAETERLRGREAKRSASVEAEPWVPPFSWESDGGVEKAET